MARFNMTFSSTGRFNMTFHAGTQTFPMSFGSVVRVGDYELYDGPYTVDPRLHESIVLPTRGMAMREDVTVNEIPVVQTTNPYDGYTVVIG